MIALLQDFRHSLRGLRRAAGLSAVVIATVATGIAASAIPARRAARIDPLAALLSE